MVSRRPSFRDQRHLARIRESVDALYRDAVAHILALMGKMDGTVRVLDVAPQDDGGILRRFNLTGSVTVLSLDINPTSGADIVGDLCSESDFAGIDSFDVIVAAEVLEHVDNPFRAMSTLHQLARVGAVLFASAPLDFRIHGPLPDNWRFTEHGWRRLLEKWEDIEIRPVETRRFLMPVHYRIRAVKP